MPITVDVEKLLRTDVLAGAGPGRRALARLQEAISEAQHSDTYIFDFSGVAIVTGSFIAQGFVPVWVEIQAARAIVAMTAIPDGFEDDFAFGMSRAGLHIWLLRDGMPAVAFPELDDVGRETLSEVQIAREATANELSSRNKHGATAWSNRLSALWRTGLLLREKRGKQFVYRAPFDKEVVRG